MKSLRLILITLAMTVLCCFVLALLLKSGNRNASKTIDLMTEFTESSVDTVSTGEKSAPGGKSVLVYANGNEQLYGEIRDDTSIQQLLDSMLHHQRWDVVSEEEKVSAEPNLFFDWRNGVAFSLISDVNQVQFGERVDKMGDSYFLLNPEPRQYKIPGELAERLRSAIERTANEQ